MISPFSVKLFLSDESYVELSRDSIKGYCKAKDFKEQTKKLKEISKDGK